LVGRRRQLPDDGRAARLYRRPHEPVGRRAAGGTGATMSAADNVVSLPAKLPKYGDAHIPPGTYDARPIAYETWARFRGWSPRVVVLWSLCTMGHVGVVIPAYYAVIAIS